MMLTNLKAHGFDVARRSGKTYRVGCSQCEAVVINGVPTHEHGCMNAVHECRGCNALIPTGMRYCAECS